MKRVCLWLPPLIFLFACGANQAKGCNPLPAGFSTADLIGTWTVRHLDESDTLVIRANGTYKQTIHLTNPSFDYESAWLPWRIEYAEGGPPYLHMFGIRLCAYGDREIVRCDQTGGGDASPWYDFCRKTGLPMVGEGLLLIIGPPDGSSQTPGDVALFSLQKGEDVWAYERVETAVPTVTGVLP